MNLVQSSEMRGRGPPHSPPWSQAEGWLAVSPSTSPRLILGPWGSFPAIPKKGDDLDLAKASNGP